MNTKHFLREKIVEEIKIVGCTEWAKCLLNSGELLAIVFSGEIEEALYYGKDIERPIGTIRDRLSAFITGNRIGDIRHTQFATIRKMQLAVDNNDAERFLQTLLSGFNSEKDDQYFTRSSRNAAISKCNYDESVNSVDHFLEFELMRDDAKKIAKADPVNIKQRIFQFWIDNFREEDFDDEWFESKCAELGFDMPDILNGYSNLAINVEQAASGNSQLVLVF
jgi:hypothetical protein